MKTQTAVTKFFIGLALVLSSLLVGFGSSQSQANDAPIHINQIATQEVDQFVKDIQDLAYSEKPSLQHLHKLKQALSPLIERVIHARKAIDLNTRGAATSETRNEVLAALEQGLATYDVLLEYRKQVFSNEDGSSKYENELEQEYENLFINEIFFRLLETSFAIMRHDVDERGHVDGRVSIVTKFTRTLREIFWDITGFARIWFSADHGLTYAPRDRYVREDTSRKAKDLYSKYFEKFRDDIQMYADDPALEYDKNNHMQRTVGLFLWLTDRAVNIRVERDSAQRYARMTYLLPSMMLSSAPFLLNFLGNSWSSPLESSLVTAAGFASLYIIKGLISSNKSTRAWVELNQQVRASVPPETIEALEEFLTERINKMTNGREPYYPAVVPDWIARDIKMHKWFGKRKVEMIKFLYDIKADPVQTVKRTAQNAAAAIRGIKNKACAKILR